MGGLKSNLYYGTMEPKISLQKAETAKYFFESIELFVTAEQKQIIFISFLYLERFLIFLQENFNQFILVLSKLYS